MNKMRLTFSRGVQETMEPALCGRWPLSLPKCTKRIQLATDIDIQNLPVSLLAMSIVASTAYTPKNRQEEALVAYASALLTKGLHLNDYHSGRTALQWAAYDGYNEILLLLLRSNCSILGTPNRFIRLEKCHALYSAVKNCQHDSVRLLFAHRQDECRAELEKEARHYSSGTLVKAFVAKDVEMVRLLQPQKAKIPHWSALTTGSRIEDFTKHTEKILKELYPDKDIFHWSKQLHWSFPASDRCVLNWIWHAMISQRSNTACDIDSCHQVPSEVWLRIFSFVGRGWWL